MVGKSHHQKNTWKAFLNLKFQQLKMKISKNAVVEFRSLF